MLILRPKAAWLEAVLVLVCAAISLARPRLGARWFRALAGRAVLASRFPVPVPRIHDEYSYLLAADTFSSGRLRNPPHPQWKYFETFHFDQQPTDMSMYPLAQGLVLAARQKLAGIPWLGVWLSSACMCASIGWALPGWLAPRWALLGGLLVVLRWGLFSYFVNSYWGGPVAATGGALVVGALPRILRRPQVSASPILAGLAILANSRPFERFPLGAAAEIAIRYRGLLRKVVLPLVLVLLCTAGAMAFYNARVYGNPLTLPSQLNRAAYGSVPVFIWQRLTPAPHDNHAVMRDFFLGWELAEYKEVHSIAGFLSQANYKAFLGWRFFTGPLLTFPRVRLLWLIAAAGSVGVALAVVFALTVQGPRHLQCWRWRGRRAGRLAICLVVAATPQLWTAKWLNYSWYYFIPNTAPREQWIARLNKIEGRHLAIVRYRDNHDPFHELVFHGANIDASKIVWARDLGPAGNQSLIEYFRSRRVWLMDAR